MTSAAVVAPCCADVMPPAVLLPRETRVLQQEASEGDVTMTIEVAYRTGSILPRSVRRIRSVLALSTLVLGSASGYWVLIEYVLP